MAFQAGAHQQPSSLGSSEAPAPSFIHMCLCWTEVLDLSVCSGPMRGSGKPRRLIEAGRMQLDTGGEGRLAGVLQACAPVPIPSKHPAEF